MRRVLLAILLVGSTLGCFASRNYPDPAGPRFGGIGSTGPAPTALRIVTFNVKYSKHTERAIRLLQTDPDLRDADLIFLQEMTEEAAERIAAALVSRFNSTACTWKRCYVSAPASGGRRLQPCFKTQRALPAASSSPAT